MSLKRFGLVLLAVLAFGAVTANSALAVATTATASWFKEATKLGEGQANGLAATCGTVGGSLVLTTTVNAGKTPVKIEAGEVECPEGKIYNETPVGGERMAYVTGKLLLKKLTVAEPVGCSVEGGKIETQTFTGELYMEGSTSYLRLGPASGAILAEPNVTGCAIAAHYQIKGSVFGQQELGTKVAALKQRFVFSKTINQAAGGALTFGGAEAQLTGTVGITLTGGGEFKSE